MHEAYRRAATAPPTPLTPSLQRLKVFAQRRRTSVVYPTQRPRQLLPPTRRKTNTRPTVPAHLKQSALKAIARAVTDVPIRLDALGVLANQCQALMDSFVEVLEMVAEENHRHTIELPDVEFLLHRTSLLAPNQSLEDAMGRELPEELIERAIPVARAQNVVQPSTQSVAAAAAAAATNTRSTARRP